MIKRLKQSIRKRLVFKFSKLDRTAISANYIQGEGIEIGGLNYPLEVKRGVRVKYVDRILADDQFDILKELKGQKLVKVDIVDDGETLSSVAEASQDFVIANHFIEHCQNVVSTIENMLRVLKPGGIIFLAIPDKTRTFDHERSVTTMEHLIRDYTDGPGWSEHGHYFDFVKYTDHGRGKSDADIEKVILELKEKNWSIHFHVWDHQAMIDTFIMMQKQFSFPFDIELARAAQPGTNESIFVLRKSSNPA